DQVRLQVPLQRTRMFSSLPWQMCFATNWMHLHFEIKNRKPSGRWGTEDSYAFLWQGYRNLHDPDGYATI
ncbi:MAG: hypothetical protein L7V87_08775, partial [Verrucomicrobiales bacterium]|nr:hypothetical protein [Verrucomicrobiales bacterium]